MNNRPRRNSRKEHRETTDDKAGSNAPVRNQAHASIVLISNGNRKLMNTVGRRSLGDERVNVFDSWCGKQPFTALLIVIRPKQLIECFPGGRAHAPNLRIRLHFVAYFTY